MAYCVTSCCWCLFSENKVQKNNLFNHILRNILQTHTTTHTKSNFVNSEACKGVNEEFDVFTNGIMFINDPFCVERFDSTYCIRY